MFTVSCNFKELKLPSDKQLSSGFVLYFLHEKKIKELIKKDRMKSARLKPN